MCFWVALYIYIFIYLIRGAHKRICVLGSRLGSGNVFVRVARGSIFLRFWGSPFAWRSQF